ncbi:MAG: hypothetical protein JNM83_27975 [Myxococcales bacterium]|nr:hypothetical protein [Myxococcales bacterium]
MLAAHEQLDVRGPWPRWHGEAQLKHSHVDIAMLWRKKSKQEIGPRAGERRHATRQRIQNTEQRAIEPLLLHKIQRRMIRSNGDRISQTEHRVLTQPHRLCAFSKEADRSIKFKLRLTVQTEKKMKLWSQSPTAGHPAAERIDNIELTPLLHRFDLEKLWRQSPRTHSPAIVAQVEINTAAAQRFGHALTTLCALDPFVVG